MLLQAVIGARLVALEVFSIGFLGLSITHSRFGCQDPHSILKRRYCELGPVVGDDPIRDPKPADDGLDKFDCGLLIDLDHRGCFRPLGELVDGDVQIPESSDGYGEWTQDVQPPHGKQP
jgi:hypothetical protein